MEYTVDLSKPCVPSSESDYKALCKLDAHIRDTERDQLEALPAVIHYLDDQLVWPRRNHRLLCRRIGLENVSGPFYEDHYLDNGVRKVFSGAA